MNDDTDAYIAIMQLQRAYADISTRHAWEEMTAVACPDATFSFDLHEGKYFEIEGASAFAEFGAKMTGGFSFYEYIPLNFVVRIDAEGGTARGRSYNLELAEDASTGQWINFYGVYDDEYAVFERSWRFASRRYRTYGRRAGDRLETFPLQVTPLRRE